MVGATVWANGTHSTGIWLEYTYDSRVIYTDYSTGGIHVSSDNN